MEHKAIDFELKDLDTGKRTAVIAHAVYGNIDLVGDISTKGMFNSSWERKSPIGFYFNHDDGNVVGNVIRTFEDEHKAYSEVKFGDWTEGSDMIKRIEANVIRGASFGYETEKKDYINKNGRKVRVLRQVKHLETSLLTKQPANPLAGIVSFKQQVEVLKEWKAQIERMESFCRHSTASDEAIQHMELEIKTAKEIISSFDTASTPLIPDGEASNDEVKEFASQLQLLTLNI